MADQSPPAQSDPQLPEKMRVHALAKLLGVTSKQVLAEATALGAELRSAQSSITREVAEQVRGALFPAEPVAEQPEAEQAQPEPEQAQPEPEEAVPAAEPEAAGATEASDAAEVPDAAAAPDVAESEAPMLDLGVVPEPAPTPVVSQAPLFLQPDPEAARERRRSRAESTEQEPRDAAAEPADSTDAASGTDAESEADADEQPRRRRRGRRGRGRGRGEQTERDDTTDESSDDTHDSATKNDGDTKKGGGTKNDGGAGKSGDKRGAPGDESPEGEAADEAGKSASADSASDTKADTASKSDTDDESGDGSASRRRRRRRRRKSGSDGADASSDDDPPNTVVHEREPRSKSKAKDEVQGISGSTRLEAKRQRRRDGRDAGRRRPPILTESEFLARREAVDRVMVVRDRSVVSSAHAATQVGVLEDDILVEHFVTTSTTASMVGNVYLGRVQNVLPSMEAAFVDIGRGRNGVLYAGEVNWEAAGLGGNSRKIEQALKPGDQVLVQVSKDPVGHKGARLTTQVSLAGRFLVYVPGGTSTGISRKLPDTERKRLKEILREVVPADAGVIIRTAAEGVSAEEIARDVERLQAQWETIRQQSAEAEAKRSGNPVTLYEEPDPLVKVIRDLFNEDFSKLVVHGAAAWDTVRSYIESVASDLLPRVEQYTDDGRGDVFAAYRIDEQLAKALDRKVWLPSGGTLVIDRTEAMTVVDVNTGKFTGSGGNLEETVTRNNLEAAEEIVRQMRLRDIGGMIVVDFIDMVLESNRDLVLRRLTEALGRDRTRHQVSEVTSLGLVQMTRKKLGTGLVEAFSTQCEHCNGRGIVVHSEPVQGKQADEGRPQRESRRKKGKDRSGDKHAPEAEKDTADKGTAEKDASVKRAHPVALAMANHHQHDESAETTVAVDVAPDAEVTVEVPETAAVEVTETVAPSAADDDAPTPAEQVTIVASAATNGVDTDSELPAAQTQKAEAASEPVAPRAAADTAATEPAESKPRRRARRVSRAAAPTGEAAGTVVVVPAGSADGARPDTAAAPEVEVEVVSRPRRRRAAARPAGPPVDAE
ncbi:translation initiation factor IF-2 N-terminal domain-containing protein [Rhodococcus sp. HNM0569]|uniref:translation initiation factor IF-2 N-terminal domain-containing protein n=1 Tax=Rhodococcus sp. HNM0569 TaxID=2716340 RepID=UPI003211D775